MSSSAKAEKYRVAEQVGKGSFGSVNVVINKETKKKYVMKKIRLARLSDWQRRSSFQELQLVSSLDHPFVVPFIEGWVDRGHTINIVYAYCHNGDLGRLLHSRKGHFTEERLKTWLAQILLGMEYIHETGVLHRDVKSSNLFLTKDYDIQIGDFGLATIRDGKSEADYSIVGTPHYMSPELLSKQKYDFATDIWSLGCVMYELTALKPAFSAFNIHGLISKVRKGSLAPLPSQYSADWCHLIRSMLKKTPAKRPSIQDLINAPCMREALTKAIKRAKNINKCFCYTKVRSETPIYWKSHFVSYCSEESPDSEEEESNAISDTQRRFLNRQSTNKSSKLRKQKSDESTENNTEPSRQPKLMKCNSNSPTEDEHTPIQEESSPSTSDVQQSNSITTPPRLEEESISKPDCNSASSIPSPDEATTVTSLVEQTEEQCDEETQNQRTSHDALNQAQNEGIEECVFDANAAMSSRRVEPLPYKVEVVDVNKLDLDAEANDSYTSRSQWSSPSHMSAYIDGKRGDGLEAIPEDSCEGSTCPLWNSLPNSTLGVSSNPSPSLYPVQELQRTLSGVYDARASSSLRDDSPFAADPRMSPSVSGSTCIDNQKRLDTVEQILTLCCSLYNKGRWHELGHILTHVPKLMNLQGRHTPEKSTKLTVCPGDKVLVGASKPRHAIVRYYGPVAFSRGDWVGLELDAPVGKTDGNISGIPYFSCPKDRGLFVKALMFSKNEVKKPIKVLPLP